MVNHQAEEVRNFAEKASQYLDPLERCIFYTSKISHLPDHHVVVFYNELSRASPDSFERVCDVVNECIVYERRRPTAVNKISDRRKALNTMINEFITEFSLDLAGKVKEIFKGVRKGAVRHDSYL